MVDGRHRYCAMAHVHPGPDYAKSLEFLRREKDIWLRDDPHSPLPLPLRSSFRGLDYFPPNPKYRFRVTLQQYAMAEPFVLATSKGVPRDMVKYGYFEFTIDGIRERLDAYVSVFPHGSPSAGRSLFVPFRDATSGKETYGAARYLDLEESPSEEYALDFNLAYNPFCAYSDDYVCPFPPRENWLTVPIRAGEKNFAPQG